MERTSAVPDEVAPAAALDSAFVASQLKRWYRRHQRRLPWRADRDPYRVWISEIMLQQTQVATVCDYFLRFMEQFPTVQRLAAAPEQEVLRLWEGLGYYRRARQLHTAARQIVDACGGDFPRDVAKLQTLPGIGRYTAGAISSIAFDLPAPILEANTIRLLARLTGCEGDTSTSAVQQILWNTAEQLVPNRGAGQFNQALMELGSLVCVPREPLCEACPLSDVCVACREGRQAKIPRTRPKPRPEHVHHVAVVVARGPRCLLRRCRDDERWSGLWDFPRFEVNGADTSEIIAQVERLTGVRVVLGEHLKTLRHSVTRYRITLDCFSARPASGRVRSPARWVAIDDFEAYPLNTTGRKLARIAAESLSSRQQ